MYCRSDQQNATYTHTHTLSFLLFSGARQQLREAGAMSYLLLLSREPLTCALLARGQCTRAHTQQTPENGNERSSTTCSSAAALSIIRRTIQPLVSLGDYIFKYLFAVCAPLYSFSTLYTHRHRAQLLFFTLNRIYEPHL